MHGIELTASYSAGGEWKPAADSAEFEVHEPYSGKLMSRVASAGAADATAAIDAAQAAFPAWAALSPSKRAALFLKAAALYRERSDEIADILSRETGSTISFARFQQTLVVEDLEAAAGWVHQPKGEIFPSDVDGRLSISIRRPLGVVACFTPWNGANILSWRAALGPLAAGNTVVIKPSEFAPVSAGLMVARIAEEAGFPAGVINVVPHAPGSAGAIADAVFASPHVRCINLIGGVGTARILAERAGRTLKRSVLELGGYNPLIVLDDVDIDFAVRTATFGAFFHQGQICMNTRKVIIARPLYNKFLEKFVARARQLPIGGSFNPATLIGPLINKAAIEKVSKGIAEAVALGAKIETGGTFDGQVYHPTILTNVPYEATISERGNVEPGGDRGAGGFRGGRGPRRQPHFLWSGRLDPQRGQLSWAGTGAAHPGRRGQRRHRDGQRRSACAPGRGAGQRLGPHRTGLHERFQRHDLDQRPPQRERAANRVLTETAAPPRQQRAISPPFQRRP